MSDAIQAIINKIDNCNCPCPGRCTCLEDTSKNLVALDSFICVGGSFDLQNFTYLLEQNGFEVCNDLTVKSGIYKGSNCNYISCIPPTKYSNQHIATNKHIAIACKDKSWNDTNLLNNLGSCCSQTGGSMFGMTI